MNQTASPNLKRSKPYFFDFIVFQVEDTLFKLPKAYFATSDVFATIFSLPSGEQDAEGTEEKPFILHGISAIDFESLLKVMYPLSLAIGELTRQEWISTLKLSTMWGFSDIRERAKQELSKKELGMGTVEKIECARRFEIKEWLLEGFNELLQRADPITDEEAEHLGWKTVAKVARLRERHLIEGQLPADLICHDCRDTLGNKDIYCKLFYCSACALRRSITLRIGAGTAPWKHHDFTEVVRDEFQEEL